MPATIDLFFDPPTLSVSARRKKLKSTLVALSLWAGARGFRADPTPQTVSCLHLADLPSKCREDHWTRGALGVLPAASGCKSWARSIRDARSLQLAHESFAIRMASSFVSLSRRSAFRRASTACVTSGFLTKPRFFVHVLAESVDLCQ